MGLQVTKTNQEADDWSNLSYVASLSRLCFGWRRKHVAHQTPPAEASNATNNNRIPSPHLRTSTHSSYSLDTTQERPNPLVTTTSEQKPPTRSSALANHPRLVQRLPCEGDVDADDTAPRHSVMTASASCTATSSEGRRRRPAGASGALPTGSDATVNRCCHNGTRPSDYPLGASPWDPPSSVPDVIGPPIVFHPPDGRWQRRRCELFGVPLLAVHQSLIGPPGGPFMRSEPPRQCLEIVGDGNCLFRAISFWITGSENHHLEIREYLVEQMLDHADLYRAHVPDERVHAYVDESRMREEGVWGTDAEIFVAANVLGTPIAVYANYGDRYLWQVIEPVEPNGPLTAGHNCMIFISNRNNHFEPVTEI